MSVALVERVLDCALPRGLRFLAVVLAHCAQDDGTDCAPSAPTLARWLGQRNADGVRRGLLQLEALGILVCVERRPGAATVYRFNCARLPAARSD